MLSGRGIRRTHLEQRCWETVQPAPARASRHLSDRCCPLPLFSVAAVFHHCNESHSRDSPDGKPAVAKRSTSDPACPQPELQGYAARASMPAVAGSGLLVAAEVVGRYRIQELAEALDLVLCVTAGLRIVLRLARVGFLRNDDPRFGEHGLLDKDRNVDADRQGDRVGGAGGHRGPVVEGQLAEKGAFTEVDDPDLYDGPTERGDHVAE